MLYESQQIGGFQRFLGSLGYIVLNLGDKVGITATHITQDELYQQTSTALLYAGVGAIAIGTLARIKQSYNKYKLKN